MEALPVGAHLYDLNGVLRRSNRRAKEIGAAAASAEELDQALCGATMTEALAANAPIRDLEVAVERADGGWLHLLTAADLLRDEDGAAAGVIVCFQGVDAIGRARDDLRKERVWARRMVENSPVAVYWTDVQGRITAFNPAAEMLWGGRPEAGVNRWCGFRRLFHPDGREMARETCPLAAAVREGLGGVGVEVGFERHDGARGAVLAYPTPLHGENGALIGAVNMLVEITERKEAELRQKALLDEVNHRVKNTLATIQSLAGQSFRGGGDPAVMAAAFEARLLALSQAHDLLARAHWREIELGVLAAAVLDPGREGRVEASGPPTPITARAAVTLAMALHELAANAERYGALSSVGGRVDVSWRPDARGGLALAWIESGGPAVDAPARLGFGRRFLENAVSRELGGRVDLTFAPEGLRCLIEVPPRRDTAGPGP
ncbi:sensor histidine kinase [Phenylobacterium sp.]|uniref:sensor histidine kinase n=1 Tax=Phenylobacterium sp. TaxID=1871053 RepID=UPI0035B0424A